MFLAAQALLGKYPGEFTDKFGKAPNWHRAEVKYINRWKLPYAKRPARRNPKRKRH